MTNTWMKTTWMKPTVLGLASVTLFATLAIAQGRAEGRSAVRTRGGEAGLGSDSEHKFEGRQRGWHQRGGQLRGGRFYRRAKALHKFVRGLELTEGQRELAQQESQALAPRARALRDEARAIVAAARARAQGGDREGARATARDELRALRERARAEFTPSGRALVASLSPEQRARIEARLAERGRTFDAERASERTGRWLGRQSLHPKRGGPATRK